MEHKHLKAIKEFFGNKFFSKTTVLNSRNIYKYRTKDLIEILEKSVIL